MKIDDAFRCIKPGSELKICGSKPSIQDLVVGAVLLASHANGFASIELNALLGELLFELGVRDCVRVQEFHNLELVVPLLSLVNKPGPGNDVLPAQLTRNFADLSLGPVIIRRWPLWSRPRRYQAKSRLSAVGLVPQTR